MEERILLEFMRPFVLFSYDVSHGLMLLRSGKSHQYETRVDVLFQDVWAIELRTVLEELVIEEVDPSIGVNFQSKPIDVMEKGQKLYQLKCKDWRGFVLGGIVRYCEDSGNFFERSSLLSPI